VSKVAKIIIGLLSFLPIVLTLVLVVTVVNQIPEFLEWERYEPGFRTIFMTISPIIIIAVVLSLLSLGLLIFFIIHMINHKKMEPIEKLIWILIFLFVGIVGYPVYWFLRIWNEKE